MIYKIKKKHTKHTHGEMKVIIALTANNAQNRFAEYLKLLPKSRKICGNKIYT
jgi:hypothetical protein